MPFSGGAGAKTFSRNTGVYTGTTAWAQTDAAVRGIRSDDHDTHDQDMATAINTSLQKNGDNSASADIPFASLYGLTGLRAGIANGETVRFEQVSTLPAVAMNGGYLTGTVSGNALTIAVKYLDGNDPSTTKPVLFNFRNVTAATGSSSAITLTSALSLTVSSGSTLGAVNSVAFTLWIVIINDGGTLRLGVVNKPSAVVLDESLFVSSTAEGGAGGADSADVIYTGTAATSKAFRVLGYMKWSSGLGAVGTWATGPTIIQTGVVAVRSINKVVTQVFTGSGTYTPTLGMVYCIIECVGGGAGGGGEANSTAGNIAGAGGGGGGSYSRLVATAATIGASQTVTIGATAAGGTAGNNNGTAGNDTSVGALCIGKGGSGGGGGAANTAGTAGAGGVAGTGDFSVPGHSGTLGSSASITTVTLYGSLGGSSGLGFGAGAPPSNTSTGNAGGLYGGGGSGGYSRNGGGTAAGGDGAQGIVVITEFIHT